LITERKIDSNCLSYILCGEIEGQNRMSDLEGMRNMIVKHAIALAISVVASPLLAQPTPIKMSIAADGTGPKIDRNIFGQFAENLGTGIYGGVWVGEDSSIPNVRGMRSDVVSALKALKVPSVRWPGGCFADEYHWRDGVGPRAKRAVTVNGSWGNALEKNDFGTDEFFDFLNQIESEAYISVNMGSGSVKEAADWMAYMTADPGTTAGAERAANGHREPYRVKFLGIGNESWSCGGAYSADYYVDEMKRTLASRATSIYSSKARTTPLAARSRAQIRCSV
jgi:alpha-N-arabinofuranosidase